MLLHGGGSLLAGAILAVAAVGAAPAALTAAALALAAAIWKNKRQLLILLYTTNTMVRSPRTLTGTRHGDFFFSF